MPKCTTGIYRIIQEQLHNIFKHAGAKNVNIAFAAIKGSIYITVEDDGKGYDVKQKRKGLGISNITHRVEAFNGKVKIQSKAGEGYKTEVIIPCASYVEEGAEILKIEPMSDLYCAGT